MRYHKTSACVLVLAALSACDDDGTGPDDGTAIVRGSVEETTPPASGGAAGSAPEVPWPAPATDAETVAIVQVEADGSFTELATAEVDVSASFSVEDVPAGRSDLAVVVYVSDRAAGHVLIHERTQPGAVVTAAPINYETSVEARVYSDMRSSGQASASSASEVALFVHMDGPDAETVVTSDAEVEALADGMAVAGATMTELYAAFGTDFDAETRGDLIAEAAMDFAADRDGGTSLDVAHETFTDAALDALIDAGATLEATAIATGGAATTLDAVVAGRSSVRGTVVAEAVRMNLRARERLAGSFSSSSEAALATAIEEELASARASVGAAATVAQLGAALDAALSAVIEAAVDTTVDLVAADAAPVVRAEVEASAVAALDTALLGARLESATTAEAAAAAAADYRADVRAAVDEMIEVAGSTDFDADVITSLYIAACGGAYLR